MTMPKKGTRKIVVDNKEFRYMIKPLFYGSSNTNRVTIESSDGKRYHSENVLDKVTPSMVEDMVRENLT